MKKSFLSYVNVASNLKQSQKLLLSNYRLLVLGLGIILLTTFSPIPIEPPNGNGIKGIFFEYGAESGVLQPPWDLIYEVRSAGTTVDAVTDQARTGVYSMKFTTPSGTKTFPQNLVGVKLTNTMTELYLSWWVYLPPNYYTTMLGTHDTIGGLKYMWQNYEKEWKMRFWITLNYINFGLGGRDMPAAYQVQAMNSTKPTAGQWNHFQIYWKESNTGYGIVRAWYNDYLLYERVGTGDFYTDPQYWDSSAPDSPYVTLTRYVDYEDPAGYIYVDDVVVATEKVPEDYRVVSK